MPALRDDRGRLRTPPEFDSPEYRAAVLAMSKSGASIREIAADTGRSKSAIAKDLSIAKSEAAADKAEAREARRIEAASVAPELETRPAARVWLGGPQGLRSAQGADLSLGRLVRDSNSSDAQTAIRASRELEAKNAARNVRQYGNASGTVRLYPPVTSAKYDARVPDWSYAADGPSGEAADLIREGWTKTPMSPTERRRAEQRLAELQAQEAQYRATDYYREHGTPPERQA